LLDTSTPTSPRATTPGVTAPTEQVPRRSGGLAERLRHHRGTALRAGVGAAVLLGVTTGVDALGEAAAEPAAAAATVDAAGGAWVPAPAVSTQTAFAADRADDIARKDALQEQSRGVAAQEAAARAAAREAAAHKAAREAARQAAREAARQAAREAARQAAARKAAAAARKAAAAAVERRAAARAAEASRNAPRDPRSVARAQLAARGWSGQFGCLDALWQRESGWNPQAYNASSGAFGIPQALPAGKMASAGADWRTNPVTQIRWGLGYIAARYGTPCGAWNHSQAYGWY
jgi:hypothetical protein